MSAPRRRFALRYSLWLRWLFTGLGLGPFFSRVELDEAELFVKMGWAFKATVPRSSIRRVHRGTTRVYGIGVHANLRFDSWLVNGSTEGIVWLDIDPPARARTAGIPVRVKRLGLGLEDPDGFVAALGATVAT